MEDLGEEADLGGPEGVEHRHLEGGALAEMWSGLTQAKMCQYTFLSRKRPLQNQKSDFQGKKRKKKSAFLWFDADGSRLSSWMVMHGWMVGMVHASDAQMVHASDARTDLGQCSGSPQIS